MTDLATIQPAIARALAKRGYETLTPVQEAVLAPQLRDADLLVSAQTGSGKTVAFGISLGPTLMGEEEALPRAEAPWRLPLLPPVNWRCRSSANWPGYTARRVPGSPPVSAA
jgi:ATP-dependent RNA helicase DeaD